MKIKNLKIKKFFIYTVILLSSIALLGCGAIDQLKDKAKDEKPGPGSISTEDPDNPVLKQCELKSLDEEVPSNCSSIIYQGQVLSSSAKTEKDITMIAAKKNGGEAGSKWFNTAFLLSASVNLTLPMEIPVTVGDGGNGQKLYIKFNDTIDCAWYSSSKTKYRKPRCFYGATRKPSASSGFSGGKEVDNKKINSVAAITMEVNGASGDDVLTITSAVFVINQPNADE